MFFGIKNEGICMKKFFGVLFFLVLFLSSSAFADDEKLLQERSIQNRIDYCGAEILNSNQIQRRVIFAYSEYDERVIKLLDTKALTKRQVIIYGDSYKYIENDDELAAFLAREIALAIRSYDGVFSGGLRSLQMKAAPKKFEIVADKLAVDYMVKAGYDPIALITYIQKTSPQKRYDIISTTNLTSKRLAIIYEYIYTKYPYYLVHNKYLTNVHYQNFLLTSQNNRRMLEEKIKTHSTKVLKYE